MAIVLGVLSFRTLDKVGVAEHRVYASSPTYKKMFLYLQFLGLHRHFASFQVDGRKALLGWLIQKKQERKTHCTMQGLDMFWREKDLHHEMAIPQEESREGENCRA